MSHFEIVDDMYRKNRHVEIKIPTCSTKGSAGYDFYLPHDLLLEPESYSKVIWTDIKAKLEEDEVLLLFIRSSMGTKKHITLANQVAVIDASYYGNESTDGNIGIMLHNESKRPYMLEAGERIVQGVVVKYVSMGEPLDQERTGGFGSTGE